MLSDCMYMYIEVFLMQEVYESCLEEMNKDETTLINMV